MRRNEEIHVKAKKSVGPFWWVQDGNAFSTLAQDWEVVNYSARHSCEPRTNCVLIFLFFSEK